VAEAVFEMNGSPREKKMDREAYFKSYLTWTISGTTFWDCLEAIHWEAWSGG
jgi:hypothetical protein